MKILIACEQSGIVRDAFLSIGHDAWSCDVVAARGKHIQRDVREVIKDGWDMMIAHPDCQYLARSGIRWAIMYPERWEKTKEALVFVRELMDAPIDKIAIENPVGIIGTQIRPADQYIQPYMFGDDASKKTGLWLKNLSPLCPTYYIMPRVVNGRDRWANQTDQGQNILGGSKHRSILRATTYTGIAWAMAQQWG